MKNVFRPVWTTWTGRTAVFIAVGMLIVWPLWRHFTEPDIIGGQERCVPKDGAAAPIQKVRTGASTIKTIQLTDAGALADRCQSTDALFEVGWDRDLIDLLDLKPPVASGATSRPKLIVIYIHGWQNDAREHDGDYKNFKELIDRLSGGEQEKENKKQVIGIYISWNARSDIPVWNYLTFWNRMNAADRIATSGTVSNIIGAVANVARKSKDPAQLIAIGHSFGARILFSATQQNFIYSLARAHPGGTGGWYEPVAPLANGVILVNPAFEASTYVRLHAQNRHEERFPAEQMPLLLTISSTADWATRFAFPAGQWLARWSASHESDDDRQHRTLHDPRPHAAYLLSGRRDAFFSSGV